MAIMSIVVPIATNSLSRTVFNRFCVYLALPNFYQQNTFVLVLNPVSTLLRAKIIIKHLHQSIFFQLNNTP